MNAIPSTTPSTSTSNLRHKLVAVVASVLAIGSLAAATAGTASAAGLPAVTSATASITGTGSVTASLTSPVAITGTRSANVPCAVHGTTYSISSTKASIDGYKVTAAMVIRNYTGPGTYTATVTMAISGPKYVAIGAVTGVKLTISATGGVWSFSRTAPGATYPKLAGKTVSGSLAYTCNV